MQMKFLKRKRYKDDLAKLLANNSCVLEKLDALLLVIAISPKKGIGSPHQRHGYLWSRRIVGKHRLVCEIKEGCIVFLSCYGHYEDH
jgi:Txe/YoeB family toxin of toxin-antitoxin system